MLRILRTALESIVGAFVCSCWPSAESCCIWVLRGVTLSPLKMKSKITNWAELSTAKSVREGAPGKLVLSSLGAFWKSHTLTFHPHAKHRTGSHVFLTQEEQSLPMAGNKFYIHVMRRSSTAMFVFGNMGYVLVTTPFLFQSWTFALWSVFFLNFQLTLQL